MTPYLPNKTRNLKPSAVFTWAHVEIVWKWNIPWSYFPSKLKTAKRFPALIRHIFVNRASFVHSSKANGTWKTKWCRKITYVSLSLAATMISQGLLNKTYRSVWLFLYLFLVIKPRTCKKKNVSFHRPRPLAIWNLKTTKQVTVVQRSILSASCEILWPLRQRRGDVDARGPDRSVADCARNRRLPRRTKTQNVTQVEPEKDPAASRFLSWLHGTGSCCASAG